MSNGNFDVVLESYDDAKKVAVVKAVKLATGGGLAESKTLVESRPCKIKTGISQWEAAEIKREIEQAGGQATIRGINGYIIHDTMNLKKQDTSISMPQSPMYQRLYDAIGAFDKFVAAVQLKLRQNNNATKQCSETFENKKKNIDDDKHKIITDIDNDVEAYRNRTLAAIDKELKEEENDIKNKIFKLESKKDNGIGGCNAVAVGAGGCGGLIVFLLVVFPLVTSLLTGRDFHLEDPLELISLLACLVVIALVALFPYLSIKSRIAYFQKNLVAYKAQKELEKQVWLMNTHATYKARKEKEKQELLAEFKYDDKIQTLKDDKQRRLAELDQQHQSILADYERQLPDWEQKLEAACKDIQRTQPLLNELAESHLRSTSAPGFLAQGQSFLNFDLPFSSKTWNKTVPHLLTFPFGEPLYSGSDQNIHSLLLRLLFSMPAGMVELTIIDPVKMGQSVEDFFPLLDVEKLVPQKRCLTHPEKIEKALLDLVDYSAELLQTRLRGKDWRAYNEENQDNPLPYKVLLMFDYPEQFSNKSATYLKRILENGMKCGILPILSYSDTMIEQIVARMTQADTDLGEVMKILVEQGEHLGESVEGKSAVFEFPLKLEALDNSFQREPYPKEKLPQYLEWIVEAYSEHEEGKRKSKADAEHSKKATALETEFWHPQDLWTQPSTDEISVPIGKDDHGNVVTFKLNDTAAHCLLAGQAGSGKSVLLHGMIQGLAHRYSPEDINFYLMDYKDGVEFNRYAKTQIPHTRLVVASKTAAEYGITVLEHLQNELTKRNELFAKHDVSDYKGYREKGHALPRVLLIIDEFQVLYQQSDAVTKKVNDLFGDILARGRSAGIHVLLATQSAKVLVPVQGFAGVKERLISRIALASSQDDSEYILGTPGCGNTAAVELRQANTDKTRYGILNTEGGHKAGNTKFLIPYPDREKCDTHQKFLAEEYVKVPTETSREVKIFDGSRLPQIPPLQEFETVRSNSKGVRVMLGEEFNFEAKPFVIDWEQKRRKNLCIAGADEAIRKGLLHSLLLSVDGQFERVIYFNTNPHFKGLDVSIVNLEVKRFDWDCDIADILAVFKEKKTLLIVDPLDEAEEFHPPANYAPLKEGTPAHSLKQFLENAPLYGSYTVAFVDSWTQFKRQFKDSLPSFELRIGFQLNVNDAGDLTGTAQFKGLESNTKAVFADIQRNEQVLFRPFIVPGEK